MLCVIYPPLTPITSTIGMHSWYTDTPSRSEAPLVLRYTLLLYIAPVLDDMRTVEEFVANEATDIDYTFVLPPGLNNKPVTGTLLTGPD